MTNIDRVHGMGGRWLERLVIRVSESRSRLDLFDAGPPESIDDQLLREVFRQMIEAPFTLISKGFNTAELDRVEVGLRGKAFRRYGGEQGLTMRAMMEALRPDRSELTDTVLEASGLALLDPAADPETILLQLGQAYFEAVCDDPCLTLQTFAWLASREQPELRRAFAELYGSLGHRVGEGVGFLLAAWGREPIDNCTQTDIASALTGLFEGLAIRTAVDPDAVSSELAAQAAVALLQGLTVAAFAPS